MTYIKDKLKRIGFKIGISAMAFFPAKSAAQDFVRDTATNTVSVRTELISKNANIVNSSSEFKDIIFYANSRWDSIRKPDTVSTDGKRPKATLRRDMITLYPDRRTSTITSDNDTKYVLLSAAVYKREKNKFEFNTDELFDKYRKLVISIFPSLRNIHEEDISIEVTYCGPFEMIIEHYDDDVVAAVCRNAYTGMVVEKNRTNKIRLFKDMATNEYVIYNGSIRRTFTDAEALRDEHDPMIMMGKDNER